MMKNESIGTSIKAAFNLGVWVRDQKNEGDIFQTARIVRSIIDHNIDRSDTVNVDTRVVDANIDYLLEVALLGYLMSGICAYDPAIKEKIPALIEKRLVKENYPENSDDFETAVKGGQEKAGKILKNMTIN